MIDDVNAGALLAEAQGDAPTGQQAAPAEPRKVPLSRGRLAVVREAVGADLEKGAAAAGSGNPISLMMGVAAQVTQIDGRRVAYEDLRALPMADVLALIGAVAGDEEGKAPVGVGALAAFPPSLTRS